ncbi:gamma carbonic anhydrase family protein [Nocardioides sp.]|uniref:gamma carbonic anhydrase family protein n=1 Tax=Nocardioides sp. TaxID=35761 RepID=UPI003D12A7DF
MPRRAARDVVQPLVITVDGRSPSIDVSAWIAPTAAVSGSVTIRSGASVWYGVSVRGDLEIIEIGRDSNLQDCSALHADKGIPLRIGDSVSVGHGAVLHGCQIGNRVLVGMSATVMNGAVIGSDSIIGAGALVTEGTRVPAGSLVLGAPAKVIRAVTDEEKLRIVNNAVDYVRLAKAHARALAPP